jgi:hypothetical protein
MQKVTEPLTPEVDPNTITPFQIHIYRYADGSTAVYAPECTSTEMMADMLEDALYALEINLDPVVH